MTSLFWASYVVLWVIVLVQGLAFLEIVRQLTLLRHQGTLTPGFGSAVRTGSALPALNARRAVDGKDASWNNYLRTEIGLIVFLSPSCASCRFLAAELSELASDDVSILAVVEGRLSKAMALVQEARLRPELVAFDEDGDTAERVGIRVRPGAVSVRDGTVGIGLAVHDVAQLEQLLEHERFVSERDRAHYGPAVVKLE